jgi:hypothetical protein
MRPRMLLLCAALLGPAWPADAACCDDEVATIKFPGLPHPGTLRGDILLCDNGKDLLVAVDLKRGKTFELGQVAGKRWADADVLDGQALLINHNRLQLVNLADAKVAADLELGKDRVFAFGFASKGRAFVQRQRTLDVLDLATGKTVHSIKPEENDRFWYTYAWQRVGNRLYLPGAATSIFVIDLDAGKICDRIGVDSRAGLQSLHIEGSLIFCRGSAGSWVLNDHVTCYDMESKKTFFSVETGARRVFGRFAGGPYGSVYSFQENRIDRYTMVGEHCGTFTTPNKEQVLAVWQQRAVVAGKDQIRILEIRETAVAAARKN